MVTHKGLCTLLSYCLFFALRESVATGQMFYLSTPTSMSQCMDIWTVAGDVGNCLMFAAHVVPVVAGTSAGPSCPISN